VKSSANDEHSTNDCSFSLCRSTLVMTFHGKSSNVFRIHSPQQSRDFCFVPTRALILQAASSCLTLLQVVLINIVKTITNSRSLHLSHSLFQHVHNNFILQIQFNFNVPFFIHFVSRLLYTPLASSPSECCVCIELS
jgi:hypothetical protein